MSLEPYLLMFIIGSAATSLTAIAYAPFLDGVRRIVKARIQRRIGPPVLQTIYDLRKLFSLTPVVVSYNWLYLSAPYIVFSLSILLSLIIPVPALPNLSLFFDTISFFYILVLMAAFTCIAGLIVPNIYSNAGAVRELLIISFSEVLVALTLSVIALRTHTLNLYMFTLTIGVPENYLKVSTLLLYLSLFILGYVEGGYIPFDVAEAETEVLGGASLEYSGRYYGLLLWAQLIKRYVLVGLGVSAAIVSPITYYASKAMPFGLVSVLSYVLFVFFVALVIVVYSTVEALNPRYRVDMVFKPLLLASIIPLIALILGWIGW